MRLVAYMITCDPRGATESMRDALERTSNVARCEITVSLVGHPYLTATLLGEVIERKLYFVRKESQVPPYDRSFFGFQEALTWAMGKDNTSQITIPSIRYHEYEVSSVLPWVAAELKHHIIPDIKRIERNIKKGALYTTVIWADRSKPTVVKCAEDDSPDIYFAVASAIAIKMYGSNSAYKRMIREKGE